MVPTTSTPQRPRESDMVPTNPHPHPPPPPPIDDLIIKEDGVLKLLQGLNPSKASGPDEIPARLLKNLVTELTPAITEIFRQSVVTSALPESWKQAWIPSLQEGKPERSCHLQASITDLHPLQDTGTHILYAYQRPSRQARNPHSSQPWLQSSTLVWDAIADEHPWHATTSGCWGQVDITIIDFSKAFDTVPHRRLLGKLEHYGICGPSLKWILEFLSGRTQAVLCDGIRSGIEHVLSGVPQGTVLSPLLFLLHINEMPSVVDPHTQCRLFADDCLLYRVVDSLADQLQLQQDLATLEAWASDWGMQFNASKCRVMVVNKGQSHRPFLYQLYGTILDSVSREKYLGVLLSQEMSWSPHIGNIVAKAHQKLGLICRNLRGSPQDCKRLAYIALVRSGLEYASIIWDPTLKKDIEALERVQRKVTRWVTSTYETRASVSKLLRA